ncbi:hypothetical protein Zmor_012371 [Zophobas morio]|uniref:Alpha/beta hydrolase fold-3 domain-containing protein n=1 Tax=Zophobas morio TaxID=2755281 RepID=A0AA38HFU6_9CUCU|nr:hypothetical protein Zmor_012371 [Zophobas morio]
MLSISHEWLFGQIFDEKHIKDYQTFINKYKPNFSQDKAENLIIHFHGGGFIAHSSLTSEAFLRDWAQMFKCPIVSVDYSLAPEKPYPAAIHDCFFVYIWCLQNFEKLGTLGRRVIFVGDSAGGNLALSTAFAASCCGIRVPDSVIPVYPVLLVKDLLSPSRCLSAIDPLLPPSVLILCLKSYAPHEDDNPFLSPILAPEELLSSLPKIRLAACEFDPLLDDSIEFAKKLYSCHTNFEFKYEEVASAANAQMTIDGKRWPSGFSSLRLKAYFQYHMTFAEEREPLRASFLEEGDVEEKKTRFELNDDELLPSFFVVNKLASFFDAFPVNVCEPLFTLLESYLPVWNSPKFSVNDRHVVLKICNVLLQRLSKTQHTEFCGRVLIFLSKLFPISEQSGVNKYGEFNVDNTTIFDAKSDEDGAVY